MRFVREAPTEINWTLISIFIIAGVLLFIAAIIVLIVFVINPNKLKREIRELDRRFKYLHSLFLSSDTKSNFLPRYWSKFVVTEKVLF